MAYLPPIQHVVLDFDMATYGEAHTQVQSQPGKHEMLWRCSIFGGAQSRIHSMAEATTAGPAGRQASSSRGCFPPQGATARGATYVLCCSGLAPQPGSPSTFADPAPPKVGFLFSNSPLPFWPPPAQLAADDVKQPGHLEGGS
ncbi:hypothetical protein S40293_11007 [Stachybotrys chartarum IBT 40293]|nr:hypothetical protein S40293_11007 [Stachybotrys chartarum IBT 40293]